MANNQYVNKVVFGNDTLIDLSSDTVAANKMLSGITAHSKSGASITGTIPTKTASDLSSYVSAATEVSRFFLRFEAQAGYYDSIYGIGTSVVSLPVPSTGNCKFTVRVPNGTTTPDNDTSSDWISLDIEVDSDGNSNISDGTIPASGVSF